MIRQGVLQLVKDVLYDTVFLPENCSRESAYLFAIPLGQYAGRTIKQIEHTNMVCAGMVPAPEKVLVQSFHCALIDAGRRPVPLTARVWDAVFRFDYMMEMKRQCALRDIADEGTPELIRAPKLDCPKQEVDPTIFFEREPRGSELLLEHGTYFSGQIKFEHPINVPLELIVALKGIRAMAVIEETEKGLSA